MHITNQTFGYVYSRTFTKIIHGTWSLLNILMIFGIKEQSIISTHSICCCLLQQIYPTWSHKNMYLWALSLWHSFTYLTARFTAVSKRNVHWVALKHRLNTWTLPRFYYLDIGTYCSFFITLLQVRIAAVQNENIRGRSLKVNALSCWKYALHQTQP